MSKEENRQSVIDLVFNECSFYKTPEKEYWIKIPVCDYSTQEEQPPVLGYECYPLGSRDTTSWIDRRCDEEGYELSEYQMKRVLSSIYAKLKHPHGEMIVPIERNWHRLAHLPGCKYVDIGDQEHHAVKIDPTISPDGWELVTYPPVNFVRDSKTHVLPLPVHGGTLDDMLPFLIAEDEKIRALLLGYLVSQFMGGNGRKFILVVSGESGSGKTTIAELMMNLCDPAGKPGNATEHEETFFIRAMNRNVFIQNNRSKVTKEQSDLYCQVAEGVVYERRTLYADKEITQIFIHANMIITSIGMHLTEEDALSRVIYIAMPHLEDERLIPEDEMEQLRTEKMPLLLGFTYAAVAYAMAHIQDVHEVVPRMADATRFAIAAGDMLTPQNPELFLEAYRENLQENADRSAEYHDLINLILSYMRDKDAVVEAPKVLHSHLKEVLEAEDTAYIHHKPKNFPATSNAMGNELMQCKKSLRVKGIELSRKNAHGSLCWVVLKTADYQKVDLVRKTSSVQATNGKVEQELTTSDFIGSFEWMNEKTKK